MTSEDKNLLVTENLRLVTSLCKKFVGKGIDFDDLYGAGCVGLVKAAKGFDATRGLQFSTYAVPVILGEIRRLFRDGGEIKVSRSIREIYLKATRVRNALQTSLDREPTISEIAAGLGLSAESVAEAFCACKSTVSLTVHDDQNEKEIELPDQNGEDVLSDRLTIEIALKKLPPEQQKLINLRYFKALTQTETAEKMSMSQVRVSRTEKKALLRLREIIGA